MKGIFSNTIMEVSQNDWYSAFLINDLKIDLEECRIYKDSLPYRQTINDDFYKLNYYTGKLNELAGFGPIVGNWKDSLNIEKFNAATAKETGKYLDSLAGHFRQVRKIYWDRRDSVIQSIESKIGEEAFMKLKNNYYNKQLEDVVMDRLRIKKSLETPERIIQKYEPAYMKPISKIGRAQFYAPYKQVGEIKIDTYWFNMMVLWIVALMLYVALYYNLLQKAVTGFQN